MILLQTESTAVSSLAIRDGMVALFAVLQRKFTRRINRVKKIAHGEISF
jgi:hypothetical protein